MRLALCSVLLLAGCSSASDITSLVAGGASGAATANPAVGFAVAVGTKAAASAGFKYIARRRQRAEQDAIAAAAGALAEGQTALWQIRHDIPVGDESGEVRLVRRIANPLAECREILFSVADDPPPAWFVTTMCRQGDHWKWAAAEPAVERWGWLQ